MNSNVETISSNSIWIFLITIYFDILAAGGRYDDLIQAYSSKLNIDDDSSKFQAPGGVGVYFFIMYVTEVLKTKTRY